MRTLSLLLGLSLVVIAVNGTSIKLKCGYKGGSWCPKAQRCVSCGPKTRCCRPVKPPPPPPPPGPPCKWFGQPCGPKGTRNCIPCYLRSKELCCRRRKLIGVAKELCEFGGKWCPNGKTCVKKGIKRTCRFKKQLPACRKFGQTCGKYNNRVCIPCFPPVKGLCCRRGVTIKECRKRCTKGYRPYCTLKGCPRGTRGHCCKTRPRPIKFCPKRCRYCKGKYCKGCHGCKIYKW